MKRNTPTSPPDADQVNEEILEPNHSLESHHRVHAYMGLDDAGMDPDDPNLSAHYAEAGAEDRLEEIGF